jgi:hypothetical protein
MLPDPGRIQVIRSSFDAVRLYLQHLTVPKSVWSLSPCHISLESQRLGLNNLVSKRKVQREIERVAFWTDSFRLCVLHGPGSVLLRKGARQRRIHQHEFTEQ